MTDRTHRKPHDGRESASRGAVVREIALTVGAIAGLLCIIAAAAAMFFGITPLVFRSGSMAPAIETGALALAKNTPADELDVGDVVNVTNASGTAITHRIVSIDAPGTTAATLTLAGDDNDNADVETYVVSEAKRVIFSVDKLGYVVTWLSSPIAVFVGGILVGTLLVIAWRPRGRPESSSSESISGDDSAPGDSAPGDDKPGRHSKASLTAVFAIGTIGALVLTMTNTPTTLAAWNDSATATSGTFTTATPAAPNLPPPNSLTCANSGSRSAQLSWPAVDGTNVSYQYVMRRSGSAEVLGTVAVPGGQTSVTISNTGFLGFGSLTGMFSYTIQSVSGALVSTEGLSRVIEMRTGILGLGTSARCSPQGTSNAATSSRLAPRALAPEAAPTAPSTTTPSITAPSTTAPSTTAPAPTSTSPAPPAPGGAPAPSADSSAEAQVETTPAPAPEPTPTTPPAPSDLIAPQASPSGSSVAKVVDTGGSPTLQITDSAGTVEYSAPISSTPEYGYGVVWASGDQLWILGPDQLVRLDQSGAGWSRSVVDPAGDEVPDEIAAQLN